MRTQTEELYDVVIYEKATRKIDAIIGTGMKSWDGTGSGRNTAELRVQTGQERINDRYECEMVAAGKYQEGRRFALNRAHSVLAVCSKTAKQRLIW